MTAGRFAEGGVVASDAATGAAAARAVVPVVAVASAAMAAPVVAVAVGAHGTPAGEPVTRSRAGAPPR